MPKPNRQDPIARAFAQLIADFSTEIAERRWGDDEYQRLVKDCERSREPTTDSERTIARSILAAQDRVASVQMVMVCVIEILSRDREPNRTFSAPMIGTLIETAKDQASRAVSDTFAASRATMPKPTIPYGAAVRRLSFTKAVAQLALIEPREADMTGCLAAVGIGARTSGRRSQPSSLSVSLREAVAAALFVEVAIDLIAGRVAAESKAGRRLQSNAVCDVATFLGRCAGVARDTLMTKVATAIEATGKRRGR
ncbi:MAG: hypothetical protein HYR85_18300 [Planctomycetes bacterium]|nr:hypothetical protein [Planctomycetota bacterium]MBI3847851.1 hypothetical protein [Planctomycetota bacterium]